MLRLVRITRHEEKWCHLSPIRGWRSSEIRPGPIISGDRAYLVGVAPEGDVTAGIGGGRRPSVFLPHAALDTLQRVSSQCSQMHEIVSRAVIHYVGNTGALLTRVAGRSDCARVPPRFGALLPMLIAFKGKTTRLCSCSFLFKRTVFLPNK